MLVANIYELSELPFLKQQKYQCKATLKEDQKLIHLELYLKFMSEIRSLGYLYENSITKLYVFDLKIKKNNKIELQFIREKEIMDVDKYKLLLADCVAKYPSKEYSLQIQQIIIFQKQCLQLFTNLFQSLLLRKLKQSCFKFNVYRNNKKEYYIKCCLIKFDIENHFEMESMQNMIKSSKQWSILKEVKVQNVLMLQKLQKQYEKLCTIAYVLDESINRKYEQYYKNNIFLQDEQYLKLQVYENYALLRQKMYLPINLNDFLTKERLHYPIYSNSDGQCKYGHFIGYNSNSMSTLEGTYCEMCGLLIQELQQNQILNMLYYHVFNPCHRDVLFISEFNRFKIINKVPYQVEAKKEVNQMKEAECMIEEGHIERGIRQQTIITYLNYYHFRTNLQKITNKNRIGLSSLPGKTQKEEFKLQFSLKDLFSNTKSNNSNSKQFVYSIRDPARGRECNHYQFTDLRLFYISYNPNTNLYTCPICLLQMYDYDVLYLKECQVLLQFSTFKSIIQEESQNHQSFNSEDSPQYFQQKYEEKHQKNKAFMKDKKKNKKMFQEPISAFVNNSLIIYHKQQKVFLKYYTTSMSNMNIISEKTEEIKQFYETMKDPYIHFNAYSLRMIDRKREKRMEKYMFGALMEDEESESENELMEEEEENQEDSKP